MCTRGPVILDEIFVENVNTQVSFRDNWIEINTCPVVLLTLPETHCLII